MDDVTALITLGILALAGGICGGLLAAALALWARVRWPRILLGNLQGDYTLPVQVELRAGAVQLPVRVAQPDPVVIEVMTGGAPTTRELAARVIATFPSVGPTDLAAIVQCSKSTAHAILQDVRAGRLSLPLVADEAAE